MAVWPGTEAEAFSDGYGEPRRKNPRRAQENMLPARTPRRPGCEAAAARLAAPDLVRGFARTGSLALVNAHGAVRITAIAVFAVSVDAMFGTSALYHRGNWAAAWHRRLQRLDHAMIFLLIAGTATPLFLISAP